MEGVEVRDKLKAALPWLLSLSAALFLALSFVPGSRQNAIFRYAEFCDYRYFIWPVLQSECPYSPDGAEQKDACYPAAAYCAVRALTSDRGRGWRPSAGEWRLLASLFVLQLAGALLLAWTIPRAGVRFATVVAVLFSPACICTMLRGNTSGWAFGLICVFIVWHRAESPVKRVLAAVALGAATALKIAPCLFGCLYLAEAWSARRCIPWREVLVAALSAALLVFLPFVFFGGWEAIPQWISNAAENARHYSAAFPIWGFVPIANQFIDSEGAVLPSAGLFAAATRALAAVFVLVGIFARTDYRRLLFFGAAMAFLTYHDYGGAYLVPAFVAWLCDGRPADSGVVPLLEAVAWFFVLTPLQMPNPFHSGTINALMQNEFLFVLLVTSLVGWRGRECGIICRS